MEGSCWGVLVFWRRRADRVGRTTIEAPRFGSLEVKIGVSKQRVFVGQCKREGVIQIYFLWPSMAFYVIVGMEEVW